MDTTPRAAALSSSCNRTLSDVETLRFDYAWKWFAFHAEQRTKMFNFMLVGLGIFATGVAAAIEKHLRLEAAVLAFAAALIAIGFRLLDRRNRALYQVALDDLIRFEQQRLFVGETKGIAWGDVHRRKGALSEVLEGRHGRLMPLVTWVFVALFAAGAVWSFSEWRRLGDRDDAKSAAATCAQGIVVLPSGERRCR